MMRRAIHLVRIDADKLANRAEAEKVKGRRWKEDNGYDWGNYTRTTRWNTHSVSIRHIRDITQWLCFV